jgi:hypothetical protein
MYIKGMPIFIKSMPKSGQYYKILTNLEEMLIRLKSCNHHGFGEIKKDKNRLKIKKLSTHDVWSTIKTVLNFL